MSLICIVAILCISLTFAYTHFLSFHHKKKIRDFQLYIKYSTIKHVNLISDWLGFCDNSDSGMSKYFSLP